MDSSTPQHFRNFTLLRLAKLLTGAVVFLVLCVAGMLTLMMLALLVNHGFVTGRAIAFAAGLAVVVIASLALYLLGRRSRQERLEVAQNPIVQRFLLQKLALQVSSILLVLGLPVSLLLRPDWVQQHPWLLSAAAFTGVFLYHNLSRVLYRCPACGYEIPMKFWGKHGGRQYNYQSIRNCPQCDVQLQ